MNRIPFNTSELEVKDSVLTQVGRSPLNVLNAPITPRENFLMYLRGEEPLWLPLEDDQFRFIPRIIPDSVARGLVCDGLPFNRDTQAGGPDMFGVDWEYVPVVGGSMVRPGKPLVADIADWEDIVVFPDIESWDWEGGRKAALELINDKSFLHGAVLFTGLFERLISFCGMSDALIYMIDEDCTDDVLRLFDRLADLYCKIIRKLKEYYEVDYIQMHDDWGSQRAPFFALDTVREMVVPSLRKITDCCHSLGMYFELHSCGKNEMLVPAMIEAGVDMWDGQPMNDKLMLCKQYGDKIKLGAASEVTPGMDEQTMVEKVNQFLDEFSGCKIYGGYHKGNNQIKTVCYAQSRIKYCGEA